MTMVDAILLARLRLRPPSMVSAATAVMLYIMYMKAIQVTMDEALLDELDRDDEVKRDGRSAFLRRAAGFYLRHRRTRAIAVAYRRAYGEGAGRELDGWADEGVWPAE